MGHKNYSKFSEKENKEEKVEEPIISEEVIEEIQDNIEEPISEEPVQTIGKVYNCECLRIRKEPNINADQLGLLMNSTEVNIDLSESTEDFYKIFTSDGLNGYCMKKFIVIK